MSPSESTKPSQEPRARAKPACRAPPLPRLAGRTTTLTSAGMPSRVFSLPSVEPSDTAMISKPTPASVSDSWARRTVGARASPGL